MAEAFKDISQALANRVDSANRCSRAIEPGKSRLPRFQTPNDMSLEYYPRRRAAEGLESRMPGLFPDPAQRQKQMAPYREPLEFDIKTTHQIAFANYFLIV